jgi:hypothetical protein
LKLEIILTRKNGDFLLFLYFFKKKIKKKQRHEISKNQSQLGAKAWKEYGK